jgi:hypothetical protein
VEGKSRGSWGSSHLRWGETGCWILVATVDCRWGRRPAASGSSGRLCPYGSPATGRSKTDAARRQDSCGGAGLFGRRMDAVIKRPTVVFYYWRWRTGFSTRRCSVDEMRTMTGGERAARCRGPRGDAGLLRDGSWPANLRNDRRTKLCIGLGSSGIAEQKRAQDLEQGDWSREAAGGVRDWGSRVYRIRRSGGGTGRRGNVGH